MAERRVFRLVHAEARRRAAEAIQTAPDGYCVTVSEPTRSLEQNAAQWPYLEGFAQQKQLCINGVMQHVTSDDWKNVLTGCGNGECRMTEMYARARARLHCVAFDIQF
jgi:hypothetical protein